MFLNRIQWSNVTKYIYSSAVIKYHFKILLLSVLFSMSESLSGAALFGKSGVASAYGTTEENIRYINICKALWVPFGYCKGLYK